MVLGMHEDTQIAASTSLDELAIEISEINVSNGFWRSDLEDAVQIAVKLALVTSEVSEALEVNRLDLSTPDQLTGTAGMTMGQSIDFTEELADIVIRVLDIAGFYGLPIGDALVAKVEKNRDRPYRHGKRL